MPVPLSAFSRNAQWHMQSWSEVYITHHRHEFLRTVLFSRVDLVYNKNWGHKFEFILDSL